MAGNEQFKRYVEAGAAFVGMTQQRAEALVKDLVGSGEIARDQAHKAVEWLVERGQRGSEDLAALIRREVRSQIESMGLATKDDIANLAAQVAAAQSPTAATRRSAAQKAPAAKVSTAKVPSAKAPAAKVPPAKAGRSTKGAPITKAATARKPPTNSPPAAHR